MNKKKNLNKRMVIRNLIDFIQLYLKLLITTEMNERFKANQIGGLSVLL